VTQGALWGPDPPTARGCGIGKMFAHCRITLKEHCLHLRKTSSNLYSDKCYYRFEIVLDGGLIVT